MFYLTFNKIALRNFPEGTLRHEVVTSEVAKTKVAAAAALGAHYCCYGFSAVTREKEQMDFQAALGIVRDDYGFELSEGDFVEKHTDPDDGGTTHVPHSYNLVSLKPGDELLVVEYAYCYDPQADRTLTGLVIDPQSFRFHLFSVIE